MTKTLVKTKGGIAVRLTVVEHVDDSVITVPGAQISGFTVYFLT